jgi:shikimate dehydrogenase
MPEADPRLIRLGLIGDNIRQSRAPRLHQLAGRLCGLEVTYERMVPAELGADFDTVFEECRGFRGINITYPYKERVVAKLDIEDPLVRTMSACNTVLFGSAVPLGFNTDYTGFIDAFRHTFGETSHPGVAAIAGAGGVGKAVGFALGQLGASRLNLFDPDRPKAEALAAAVTAAFDGLAVEVADSFEEAAMRADGLVNCTPLGMAEYGGTAIPKSAIGGQHWAFDAVYTPVDTEFMLDARAAGLSIMSGYELFFYQGVNAFRIFTGGDVDQEGLRQELRKAEADPHP